MQSFLSNVPCRPRTPAQTAAQQTAIYTTMDGTSSIAPVMNPLVNPGTLDLPFCDQVTIFDQIIYTIKNNPVPTLIVAAAVYYFFFHKK